MLKRVLEVVAEGLGFIAESSAHTVLNLKPRIQLDGYSCGLQCVAAIVDYYGYEVDLDDIADELDLTTEGCDEDQIRKTIRAYGLRHRTHNRMSLQRVFDCIDNETPVLVSLGAAEHWSVVYGYGDDSVYVMDPILKRTLLYAGRRTLYDFMERWNDWGIVVYE